MKIFLDTNILIDVAQGREPFYETSAKIVLYAHQAGVQSFISWHSMATIFYIMASAWDADEARAYLSDLLEWNELPPTNRSHALAAISMGGKDFEDDLQIQCAIASGCDCIISRNPKDFGNSPVPCFTPDNFLQQKF